MTPLTIFNEGKNALLKAIDLYERSENNGKSNDK